MGGESVRKSISIPEELDEVVDNKEISLSALVQDQLREMKDSSSEEDIFRYTPTKVLREGMKQGFIIMLTGALILTVSMGVFSYLWLTARLPAFAIIWIAGASITYYGARQYSKWNDILYYRSRAEQSKEEEKG